MQHRYNLTAQDIEKAQHQLPQVIEGTVMLGWDAFLDNVWEPVSKRINFEEYRPMKSMLELARRIDRAAGSGLSTELVKKDRRGGGFTVNVGRALKYLGIKGTSFGLYGENGIYIPYQELQNGLDLISYGEPCYSNIFEFDDGKLMFPSSENITEVDWSLLTDKIGRETIKKALAKSDIIGQGYWANMPAFNNILQQLARMVADMSTQKLKLFIDFGNVKRKSGQDLLDTLEFFKGIAGEFDIYISMNRPELMYVAHCLGMELEDPRDIPQRLPDIKERMNIGEAVVHTPDFSCNTVEDKTYIMEQIGCEDPVLTTGAGDTFNGGYLAGLLAGVDPATRLIMATATARYYVEQGLPPQLSQLKEYLEIYLTLFSK